MTGWLQLTDEQRRTSIAQAAVVSGIAAKAIEKDWWVTLTLKALFESHYAKFFIFKGGTSLSKGWKLIERFSEDIDIALDPLAFGKEYKTNPSHTYVKTLKKLGCEFTSTVLLDALKAQFNAMGIPMNDIGITAETVPETIPDRDPQTLYVKYKSLYPPHGYIADEVKIEFSVRSLKDPYATISIQSILFEAFPNIAYAETPFEVVAVEPRKTLLEKAFLLHEKFLNVNTDKVKIERLSRHLYDLVKLMNTEAGIEALKDYEFYTTLLEHRKSYVRLGNVDYDTLHYSTLSFIPPDAVIEMFRQDYRAMQAAMIYGASLDFDTMINELKILTGRFRLINEYHVLENIIKDAALQIDNDKSFESEGATFSTPVTYHTDMYKLASPANKTISYTVAFIWKKNKWVFESIAIN
ncbi:nucleotidyl transferase AbiEii/AbiGii toxin family protein [Ferruginibacter sp.]|nr:nucleotidyl transferase AbiEii/AbiGii toxin family protein [Ferruginibacter sp.]